MMLMEPVEREAAPRPSLTERFDEAMVWASELHREQRRKGSDTPYVAHLLSAAALVLENGGDEDEAIAALLHDAVEDCGGRPTAHEIRRRFGERVADIVDGCTDSDETPKPAWRPRKERFIERLAGASASVRLVSAADKLHNARSVLADLRREGERVWERFSAPRHETLWYYRAVTDRLRAVTNGPEDAGALPLVEELERVVTELEERARATAPR
ncbi:MAG: HD domain-containing protein [Acidobacteriota bacterium]